MLKAYLKYYTVHCYYMIHNKKSYNVVLTVETIEIGSTNIDLSNTLIYFHKCSNLSIRYSYYSLT